MEGVGGPWWSNRVLEVVSFIAPPFLISSLDLPSPSMKRRSRTPHSFLSNLLPYSYRRGRRYDLHLAAPPALQDRYVGESPILRDAKRTLQPWVWNACNIALDHVFLDGQAPLSAKDLTRDREVAMKLAVTFFSTHRQLYPGRPDEALPPSPSVEALRKVLSEAPIAPRPRSAQWGAPLQGLVFVRNEAYEYYDWNAEYLERVFTAARDVVGKHGACDGWAKARWDVYDKVCLATSTLVYLPRADYAMRR